MIEKTKQAQRTPGPWRIDPARPSELKCDDGVIAAMYQLRDNLDEACAEMDANAAFIVRACNAYDANQQTIAELVAAQRCISCGRATS